MMRAIRIALRGLLAVAVLAAIGAPVEAKACATAESIVTQIRQESPAAEIRFVGDPLASRLRMGISVLVGRQVPFGGKYLLAHAPSALTTYVVRFEKGCATHHGRFPDELLRAWLEGRPA